MKIFAHSNMDVIPVLAGIAHLAFVLWLYLHIPVLPWRQLLPLCTLYAISISWNINGVSHNFLHNPYFNSQALNRAFSLVESLAIGFSQAFYTWVHNRHHSGNSDRPDDKGETIDWLSIYRHGKNGQPEDVWGYAFKSFFRDDIKKLYQSLYKQSPANARFGIFELACLASMVAAMAWHDWKSLLVMVLFNYLGNCLSSLNGYYEHLNGNPDMPIAWGVSSYNRIYNWLWFYNGYHAEHHFRPRTHWTAMRQLHEKIAQEQTAAHVHTISTCHALGFLAQENRAA
jgi:fatty acid desaturase